MSREDYQKQYPNLALRGRMLSSEKDTSVDTAFGKTDCAHQGVLMAGRVLGGAAIDFFADPALVEEAWRDFRKNLPGEYISPVEGMEPDSMIV